MRHALTRVMLLVGMVLAGCESGETVAPPDLSVAMPDLFECRGVTVPTTSTACQGTAACAPGEICVIGPGGPLLDGGFTQGRCLTAPPECQVCGGCISNGGTQVAFPVGCFVTICHSFACSFGAGILSCD